MAGKANITPTTASSSQTIHYRNGVEVNRWVRQKNPDIDRTIRAMAAGAMQELRDASPTPTFSPLTPLPSDTANTLNDRISLYLFGDPHHSMLAHKEETGENHDLKISIRRHRAALRQLVTTAPSFRPAMLVTVGDTFHSDNTTNRTNRSNHPLDVDTRWDELVKQVAALWVWKVNYLLDYHSSVHVEIIRGNHDDHSAVALQTILHYAFQDTPEVTVNDSSSYFHARTFGNNFFGFYHGHTTKPQDVSDIFSHDFKKMWGDTQLHYLYQGHLHHRFVVRDLRNAQVECLRTLATNDSYAAAGGYRSPAGAKRDDFDFTHGHIASAYAPISLLTRC